MTRRIRTTGISPSRRRCISKSHCYYWRWHHLAVAFIALVGLGIALAASIFTVPPAEYATASASENVMGWAWADPIGWISLNDTNAGSGGGTYGVNVNLSTGDTNGFGWSENAGWVCFGNSCSVGACTGAVPASNPPYNAMVAKLVDAPYSAVGLYHKFHGWAKVCNEGDLGWISMDCEDLSPSACGSYAYHVPFSMSTLRFEDPRAPGSPLNGTSFAWNGNTDLSGFGYIDFSRAYLNPPPENTEPLCSNGIDDDLDGAIDCADSDCASLPICAAPPPPIKETDCTEGNIDLCCSNGVDDDFDGLADCNDPDCQGVASMCTIAWLKTEFGSIYAQKGIEAIAAPAAQYNASYCLSLTEGSIVGFASQLGCTATTSALTLPKSGSYRGSLGNIDVAGIRNGRYGQVVQIADGYALPDSLDGKVYRYSSGGILTLPSKMFQNGTGSTGRGNGLLFVDGADLRITSNMSYAAPTVDNYLRNLASFGVIVITDQAGNGGRIIISPGVSHLVGAIFAETSISTGASDTPLDVFGLFASRLIAFERTGGTSSTAAETVSFDGRAVANPPPGMQDVGKSLPTVKEAF